MTSTLLVTDFNASIQLEDTRVHTWDGLQHLVDEGYEVSVAPDIWEPLDRGWNLIEQEANINRYYLVRPKAPEPITVEFGRHELGRLTLWLESSLAPPSPLDPTIGKLRAALNAAKEG